MFPVNSLWLQPKQGSRAGVKVLVKGVYPLQSSAPFCWSREMGLALMCLVPPSPPGVLYRGVWLHCQ